MADPPPRSHRTRRLRWWHAIAFFFIALAGQLLIGIVYVAIAFAAGGGGTADEIAGAFGPGGLAVQVLITTAWLVLLAALPARVLTGRASPALGLTRPRGAAVALAVAGVLPAGIVIDQVTFGLTRLAPSAFDTGALAAFADLFAQSGPAAFALAAAAVTIGPAIGEELFFRGFVLRALRSDLPAAAAVAISSLLFGLLHLDPLQGAGAALVGGYLGYVALATGSVWPAAAGHAANNLVCSLAARLDPKGAGVAFERGHPWTLVALAAAALALVVFRLELSRRRTSARGPR